jgi:hypothetical protein
MGKYNVKFVTGLWIAVVLLVTKTTASRMEGNESTSDVFYTFSDRGSYFIEQRNQN